MADRIILRVAVLRERVSAGAAESVEWDMVESSLSNLISGEIGHCLHRKTESPARGDSVCRVCLPQISPAPAR